MSRAAANKKSVLTLDQYPPRLRVDQASAYLNCSDDHIVKLIRCGAIEAVNVSGPGSTRTAYRITREALSAFERARKSA